MSERCHRKYILECVLMLPYLNIKIVILKITGNFSVHHHVQNGSGAHPASYSVDTRGSFPGGKAAGAWSWPLTFI
jgi:hypothetical protein